MISISETKTMAFKRKEPIRSKVTTENKSFKAHVNKLTSAADVRGSMDIWMNHINQSNYI